MQLRVARHTERLEALVRFYRDGRELRFRNVPDDDPASLALDRLGAQRVATQHEMRLRL